MNEVNDNDFCTKYKWITVEVIFNVFYNMNYICVYVLVVMIKEMNSVGSINDIIGLNIDKGYDNMEYSIW